MKKFVLALALAWATSASAIQHYAQTVLPFGFFGSDRNSAGTIVGSFTNSSGGSMAAAFAGGSVTLLPGADFARGINDLGTMIAVTINSRDHGFIRAAGDQCVPLSLGHPAADARAARKAKRIAARRPL